MTVSESIISWLKTYEPQEFKTIDTDIQSAITTTYALTKEPTVNVKNYLSGKREKTEYYQLTARLDTQTNADRKVNSAWLESLEKWVVTQNKNGNRPTLTNAVVTDVSISSSYYLGRTNENDSLYSLTIAIKYYE